MGEGTIMRYFATSDLHLGHSRVIEYANRPFRDSFHMNESLIKNWNMRVTNDDIVFHVGDFVFKSGLNCEKADFWIKRLNGNTIFIRGNHDNNNSLKTLIDSVQVTFANRRINLCHIPEHSRASADINIVGHVHQYWRIRTFKQHYDIIERIMLAKEELVPDRQDLIRFLDEQKSNRNSESILLNCGVDVQGYKPITLDEVVGQCMKFKKIGV